MPSSFCPPLNSHNSITSLPERVHRLRDTVVELIAHDNLINSLPNNMGLLSKLTSLNLSHNCLDKLPPSMDKLKRLK
jgi:Leucine-rich repeat (LRR) protein